MVRFQPMTSAEAQRLRDSHRDMLAALEGAMGWLDHADVRHLIGNKLGEMSHLHKTLNAGRKAIANAQ